MYEVNWVKGETDGRIGVVTPYNGHFKDELKAVTSSAKFRRSDSVWLFDEEVKPFVQDLVERYFTNTRWMRVTFENIRTDNITIDGAALLYVNRDSWNFRRDTAVNFRTVEQSLSSGGSRANPIITGNLVIDLDIRDGADISPEPSSIEPAPDINDKPNPFANLPTADLMAELERRGVTVEESPAMVLVRQLVEAAAKNDDYKMNDIFEKMQVLTKEL